MSKERLSSALSESELVERENNFDNERLKKIRKDFNELRDRFSKLQIKEIRRNLHDIKNPKNLSTQKIKEIEESVFKLEECFSNFEKYRPQDHLEHKNLRDIRNLFNGIAFNQSIGEDYYKPIKTKSSFNVNYMEYESKGDKDTNLSLKKYLYMIITILSNRINDHKTPKKIRFYKGNKVIDYKTQYGNWKIRLTMSINFISSKDCDETRNMHTKSDKIEIMMGSKTNYIIEGLSKSPFAKISSRIRRTNERKLVYFR